MADQPVDSQRHLLAANPQLAQQVRRAQRATWFPLVLLGLVVAGATPFYGVGHGMHVTCGPVTRTAGGSERECVASVGWPALAYWSVALVVAYVVIAGFYVLRARRRGVGTRIVPYAWAGIATLALVLASVWPAQRYLGNLRPPSTVGVVVHGLDPLLAIGIALFVLAWVERHRALLVFALAYTAVAVFETLHSVAKLLREIGWVVPSHWVFLPGLWLAAVVLLLGGAGFAVAERART
jgi:hypothetical protein